MELRRIPGPGLVQGLTGQGGTADGRPRLERRRRRKRRGDGSEDEETSGAEAAAVGEDDEGGPDGGPNPEIAGRRPRSAPRPGAAGGTEVGAAADEDEDEPLGKHIDVRA